MVRTEFASCTLCEASCGIAIETEAGRIISIRGDKRDLMSQGYVCPKVMGLKDVHEDPDRLRSPVKRHGDTFVPIAWDEAFDLVGRELNRIRKTHGRRSVAVYQGNPTVHNLGLMTFGQLLFRKLRTRNAYSATSTDQLPHMLSSLLMFGHQLLFPVPDIDHTDHFLVFGANPLVSNGSLMTAPNMRDRIRELRERGGTVVVVDPRRTETAAKADEHVFIRPGTDAFVLMAMVHTLFDEQLVKPGRLATMMEGEAELRIAASQFPPERVAKATGVSPKVIRQLARNMASARSAVCYGRIGISTQEFGGVCSWLINAINILTGNFDRRGGAMFSTPAVDLVALFARLGKSGSFNRYQSRVRGLPEFGGELPVAALAEEIETPGEGQIRALITSAGNPVLSIPNGARLERALPQLDFMVSLDLYINETTRHADVILPPTFALERDHYDLGLALLGVRNAAKYSPAVFERADDQRHDWEICLELLSRIDQSPGLVGRVKAAAIRKAGRLGPSAILAAGLRLGPHPITLGQLSKQPHGVDLGPLQPRLPGLLATDSKRIRLAPEPMLADLKRLEHALDRVATNPDTLSLIGRRQLRSNNSWLHNSERLVKGKPRCTLLMNPRDASERGLDSGSNVVVTSRVGSVCVPLETSEDMMVGVVSLPHGWGHDRAGAELRVARRHAGASVNDLTDEALLDDLSGNSRLSGVPVEVTLA